MKLISLNVEGQRHLDKIEPFLARENADVICLQEADSTAVQLLEKLGYTTSFLPIIQRNHDGTIFPEGEILASKHPFTYTTFYYHQPEDSESVYEGDNKRETVAQGCIVADITVDEITYTVATTHFTWTPDGSVPNEHQKDDTKILLEALSDEKPHILCGDLNIPRHHNKLYKSFTAVYTDTIPETYTSSLDKNVHYRGASPTHAHLFTDYMVDYLFTQSPYEASNVRLEFGLSDHAAVIATIEKT